MVALFSASLAVAASVGVSTVLAFVLAISRDLREDRASLQGQYSRYTDIDGLTLWRLTEQHHGLQERERRIASLAQWSKRITIFGLGVGGVGLFAQLYPNSSRWVGSGVQDVLPVLAILTLLAHIPLIWNVSSEAYNSRYRQFDIEPSPPPASESERE